MLLDFNNTQIKITCQQYICTEFRFENNSTELWMDFKSQQDTKDVCCEYCGNNDVEIHDNYTTKLTDMPIWSGIRQFLTVTYHKYKCRHCNKVFNEDICFKDPDARVTTRAAVWAKDLLKHGICINSVSKLTGINWAALNTIHMRVMEDTLDNRKRYLKTIGYKPTYLAVDEFAIHKGHTYASCVMDLETGEVLWVGKGRGIEDFREFFLQTDLDYLSNVKAFAMDMNASYNRLVEEYLPNTKIVYDRYHMQAQFGKEVLGSVRLEEARKHKDKAETIRRAITSDTDIETKRLLKAQAKDESRLYSKIKNARWTVLANSNNLTDTKKEALEQILTEHNDLAVCYAMKEEMCDLFDISDPEIARIRWNQWFKAAEESGIPQLIKFAELKEKRIEGLIAHASYPISTGKLEGLNNKIKVAKRVGYGYRDDNYFFTLVRYISLPANFIVIPQKM